MLTPSKWLCTWPLIFSGGSTPSRSRIVGTRSTAWWYCSRIWPGGGLVARPADDARVGRAAVELVALPHLERRVEGHRPTVRVVVVGRRPAQLVEHREARLEVVGDAVEQPVLVDGSVRAALAARAVVRHQDDERVLALAGLLEVVEQPADLVIGVRQEAGVDLRHSGEQPLLVVRERVPGLRVLERRERLAIGPLPRLRRADRVERAAARCPPGRGPSPSGGRGSVRASPRSPCRTGP